jgi:lysine-specific histone demethylase 1
MRYHHKALPILKGGACPRPQVVLLFARPFWGKPDMFGRIAPRAADRGEFFLFYSYAHISGGAVLAALVAGDAALRFEKLSPEEAARKVLGVLRGIFAPKGVRVPPPLQARPEAAAPTSPSLPCSTAAHIW